MKLHGKNILGKEISSDGHQTFQAVNPATASPLEPLFYEATISEIDRTLELANRAFYKYRQRSAEDIAGFLDRMADEIMNLGDTLIERATAETALPEARLQSERARTVNQIHMFAELVREGSWVDARIDRALPDRKPLPKPDIRRMLIPIGPVVVFGASNFPLAFSVAGGDTVSALAAGNPVVVKAHPAHPGTSELAARAILKAMEATGMPDGVFSMLHGAGHEVGLELVRHPLTKAVGFTGSLKAGRALFDAAAARPNPIPVYAEMGSINPVFVLPGALKERGEAIAGGLAQSVTLGAGQFCTNPGLVVGLQDEHTQHLIEKTADLIAKTPPATMLTAGICRTYAEGIEKFRKIAGVHIAGQSQAAADREKTQASAVVFATDAGTFLTNYQLGEEVFGPSTLIVRCNSGAELEEVARSLEGHLTATIHGTDQDLEQFKPLITILETKVGRLLFNGFPTGVEVCPSMHHGGPYPATTDVRSTSVGTAAIQRFARPICYQNFPQTALPVELQNRNKRNLWRLVDNKFTKEDG
jgi:NADP-dependent aldehyde dehydrogenase